MDPKTAERGVSTGRTPHRTTAYKAARALREDMAYLWPSLEQGRRRRGLHPELIALHDARADAPFDPWRTLFIMARERARLLGGDLQVSDESLEVRWVPADELDDLPMHHTQRLRLRHYREGGDTSHLG